MNKTKFISFTLIFALIFTIFTVASSAKIERYDLTSDQITYYANALSHVEKIIDSIYGNTFSLYQADDRSADFDQFLRHATYYLRKDFVDSPVEKCEYEIILNDISEYNNGKAVHFTVVSDIYTANSEQPTVKELDIFVKISFSFKVLVVSDIYIAEKSLESVISPESEPMTLEKFLDWADKTNEAEYDALAEKLKPETETIINHYERDIFNDICNNKNENVVPKNPHAVEAFEQAKNFLSDYFSCIVAQKPLETDVPMASEAVSRYLAAMTKYNHMSSERYDAESEFICLDSYVYENNIYLEVQILYGNSSTVSFFRFIKQDDGTLAIANFCENYPNFDCLVFDWNSYGSGFWFDTYIQDFKTIDYAEVIDRAEKIAEEGYFESDKILDMNNSVAVVIPPQPVTPPEPVSPPAPVTPPNPVTQPENEFLNNPLTSDLSIIFYTLAVISAVLSCITFKKKT